MKPSHCAAASVLLSLFGIVFNVHAETTLEAVRSSGTINVGYRESSTPFSYLDTDKKPIGYSIDICMSLVEAVKRELKLPKLKVNLVPVKSAERLPFVIDKKIDLECGNTTATAERRKRVAFTVPMFMAGAGVLVRTQTSAKALVDLKGKKVIVEARSTGENVLNEANKQNFGLVSVLAKDSAEAFAALQTGAADAWITDDILLASFRANADKPTDYELLARRHTVEPLAIMHRLNDPAFESIIDREMLMLFSSGQIELLYRKWFQSPIPPKGVSIGLAPSFLLREFMRSPSKTIPATDMIWM